MDKGFGRTRGRRDGAKERRSVEMICVTVEIREGALMRRALKIARDGKPGREVRLDFPIDPEAFFIPPIDLERMRVIDAPGVTHLTFRVVK